jgi:hypothetical protein
MYAIFIICFLKVLCYIYIICYFMLYILFIKFDNLHAFDALIWCFSICSFGPIYYTYYNYLYSFVAICAMVSILMLLRLYSNFGILSLRVCLFLYNCFDCFFNDFPYCYSDTFFFFLKKGSIMCSYGLKYSLACTCLWVGRIKFIIYFFIYRIIIGI